MIHLDARLRTALEISPVCRTAADIACDHGKLGAALLLGHVFLLEQLTTGAIAAIAGLTVLGAAIVFGTAVLIRKKEKKDLHAC